MHHLTAFVFSALLALPAAAQTADAVVGESLGKPILNRQVAASRAPNRAEALRELFISPAIGQYLKANSAKVELTAAERKKLTDAFNASMACDKNIAFKPDAAVTAMFVDMMGGNAKAQRFIYQQHGQGRVLFQQGGEEAFDATHRLILSLEKAGKFKFTNPADRTLALAYWTTDKHGAYLRPDPGIDQVFLLDELVDECLPS
jgi:hypothetical protein